MCFFLHQELFDELRPVLNPEQNHYGGYPTLTPQEYEKESKM